MASRRLSGGCGEAVTLSAERDDAPVLPPLVDLLGLLLLDRLERLLLVLRGWFFARGEGGMAGE